MSKSLIDQIADARMYHRKRRDYPDSKRFAINLTTLYGEASIIGKNNGRETTDDETVKVIQRFIKGLTDIGKHRELTHEEQLEVDLYKTFLPATLTTEETEQFVDEFINVVDNITMKLMGTIMTELKKTFPGRVDGKVASSIIKQKLQSRLNS